MMVAGCSGGVELGMPLGIVSCSRDYCEMGSEGINSMLIAINLKKLYIPSYSLRKSDLKRNA